MSVFMLFNGHIYNTKMVHSVQWEPKRCSTGERIPYAHHKICNKWNKRRVSSNNIFLLHLSINMMEKNAMQKLFIFNDF